MALMDVHSGEILALASSPGFDLTDLRQRWSELTDITLHPERPLEDNATWATHPPGSVVKPFVGLVALHDGHVTADEQIYSQGYMALWRGRPVLRDHRYAPPGDYDIYRALKMSSNVCSPQLPNEWAATDSAGGLTALALAATPPPTLNGRAWLAANAAAHSRPWVDADTWRMSIGQYMSTSPLQAVVIPALVANGGQLVTPHVVPGTAAAPKTLALRRPMWPRFSEAWSW